MRITDKLNFNPSKVLPSILQTDPAESGLACIAMIVAYYQMDGDFHSLRRDFPVSSRGMTVRHVVDIATNIKFSARQVDVELENFAELTLPCIFKGEGSKYFVLKSFNSKQFVVHDPDQGVLTLSREQFPSFYSGTCIDILPSVEFIEAENSGKKSTKSKASSSVTSNTIASDKRRFSWRRLLGSTKGLNSSLIQVCALAFAMELMALLLPLVNQIMFDQVVVTADTDLLTLLGLGLIVLELTRVALNTLRGWTVMILSTKLNVQWISNVFSHLLRLPIEWFDRRHIGDISSRFESVYAIQGMVTTRTIEVGLDGVMSLGALVMIFFYNPMLASLVVSIVIIYFLVRMMWFRRERNSTEAGVVYGAQQSTLFLETLRSVKTIRLFNSMEDRKTRWLNRLIAERNAQLKTQRISIYMQASNWVLFAIERVAVLWLGISAVIGNEWSIGMLLAFIAYKDMFTQRAFGVVNKIMEFKLVGIQAERLSDIVLAETEVEHPPTVGTTALPASLSVSNVSFRYSSSDPLVVNSCNFHIKEGECVAIVGASGCGKSTLLKIMLGVVKPETGRVEYGGADIKSVGTRAYRDLIGVVLQDDQLFSGTITENITFFTENVDREWLEKCTKIASIHDEIMDIPTGYHTLIGDMGASVSGGQKQRLLLARALYKKPKMLFLDEATSHLDVSNETIVNSTVRNLGVTTVVIAHRPETIRMADRILLMENGSIREVGKNIIEELTEKALQSGGVVI